MAMVAASFLVLVLVTRGIGVHLPRGCPFGAGSAAAFKFKLRTGTASSTASGSFAASSALRTGSLRFGCTVSLSDRYMTLFTDLRWELPCNTAHLGI